ncbi:Chromodomain-helicase-DNA-binding protein Mi-2 [Fasciola hepatica]|uniref:Chromodomain-helicase-DNA-binding protein Mi-2 n=1 Tax=Fasciola hepatica TaxID=6192 RepID=A0A4E0RJA1_FASHE|nr:Chromodomain-helicase-DNA-binding protein Mi-2 [Fasciola hepatica]
MDSRDCKKRVKSKRSRNEEEVGVSPPKRRSDRVCKKEKTVDQLCEELAIEDVELTYSTEDFENWTIQKLFDQYVRPLIIQKNPHAPKEDVQKIMDAKWKEFAIMNPYIPKGEEELDDDFDDNDTETQEDDLSEVRVTSSVGRKRPRVSTRKSANPGTPAGYTTPLSGCAGSEAASQSPPPSPAVNSQVTTPPIKIKISKKKKKRGRRRTEDRVLGGNNTSDEEFERQLEEAEMAQDEERDRRKRSSKRQSSHSTPVPSGMDVGGPANSKSHQKTTARFPLIVTRKATSKNGDEEGYETDHQDYCEVCQQGGEIMLCDTCPRAYHLVCLDPELEEAPEGTWSCPHCEKEGVNGHASSDAKISRDTSGESGKKNAKAPAPPPPPVASPEKDEHQEYCTECRDGGDLICCENCPASYHMACLTPPLASIPEGVWLCPRCGCKPLRAKVARILTWRWFEPPKLDELDHTHHHAHTASSGESRDGPSGDLKTQSSEQAKEGDSSAEKGANSVTQPPQATTTMVPPRPPIIRRPTREFFVKYVDLSYWHCEWLSELQMDVHHPIMLRNYFKKNDMEEPPLPEDGSTYRGKAREKVADPHNLDERFYKWGVRPEWLQIQRIIDHRAGRGGHDWYLVKWRDLSYDECTWEEPDGGVTDIERFIEEYRIMRQVFMGNLCSSLNADGTRSVVSLSKKHKSGRRSNRDSATEKLSPELIRKLPPDRCLTELKKQYLTQPDFIEETNGQLHPYQLEGVNWLRFSYGNKVDTILADEMGLGKTIQTIAFLYSLYKEGHSRGPFLVAAPLSTLINWEREFEFWAPDLYVVSYVGDKDSRMVIREHEFSFEEGAVRGGTRVMRMRSGTAVRFHVLLTSYELISIDQALLGSIDWEVLVVDEAHRLKNNQSKFFRILASYHIAYKLLLTGTPLQNNLEELFHLLHFMTPEKFHDMQGFLDEFADISKEEQVKKLHDMLGQHLLRRLKADVLQNMPSKGEFIVRVELSPMQKRFYKFILTRNFEALSCRSGGSQVSLINIVMDLKKCCNHPYLFPSAAEEAQRLPNGAYEGVGLRKASGKLELMSKMMRNLYATKHRVLIFSQMTKMLDLLEDFLDSEGYKFERIDGAVTGQMRQDAIDRFNAPDSPSFAFLLSTRAGGLGINLASADTVIIYDSDWNPHNDIQAFSRAHRIGQANKVMIYRFVTRGTVEERVTQVAKKKMMLTHLVVRPGLGGKGSCQMSKKELDDILKFGTEDLFKEGEEENEDEHCIVYDDAAISRLLDRSQQGLEEKALEMNDYLTSFKVAHYEKKGVMEEDDDESDDDDENREVIKQELDPADPTYWEKLLRHHFEQAQEDQSRVLGKGKRVRKQVNYSTTQEEEEEWNQAISDHDSDFSNKDEDDDEYDESTGARGGDLPVTGRRTRREREGRMPPVLSRINGQIEVLGFNSRQRRSFLNAIMRYGLPPSDQPWNVRELRCKPDRVMRAYTSLFMRHMCEPDTDNSDTFSDGVPREGMSPQHVLSRIGIMALVRRKVREFENINGHFSMPEAMPKPNETNGEAGAEIEKATESELTDVSTAVKSGDSNIATDASDRVKPNGFGEDCISADDASKASDKTDPMELDEQKATKCTNSTAVEDTLKVDQPEEGAVDGVKPSAECAKPESSGIISLEVDNTVKEFVPQTSNRFMFNIADGGFTELHTIWLNEQRALVKDREAEIWHRRHDYWLLAGVVQHGYGRWQDIHNDCRFLIVNEPFKNEAHKPNYLELKNRFLARRFKLLEQALIIEEQLRRAAQLGIAIDPSESVQNLNRRFFDLECLATGQQQLFNEALAGNKALVPLLHKVLTLMEDLLADMKQDVSRLINLLPRLPPVSQRLQLSHTGLLSQLTQQLASAKASQAKASSDESKEPTPMKIDQ